MASMDLAGEIRDHNAGVAKARRERIAAAVLGSLACFAASQYDRREYAPHFASMVSSAVNLADALIAELDK